LIAIASEVILPSPRFEVRCIAFSIDGMYVSTCVGCLEWIPGAVMLMCIDFWQIAQACRLTNIF